MKSQKSLDMLQIHSDSDSDYVLPALFLTMSWNLPRKGHGSRRAVLHTWDVDVRVESGLVVRERLEHAVDIRRDMNHKLGLLVVKGVAHHLGGIHSTLRDQMHLPKYRPRKHKAFVQGTMQIAAQIGIAENVLNIHVTVSTKRYFLSLYQQRRLSLAM